MNILRIYPGMVVDTDTIGTIWFCEACELHGRVIMDEHTDAWSGLQSVSADHRSKSPECSDPSKVRVWREDDGVKVNR